jgi:flagellar hook-basal body complex protein FliE
MLPIGPLNPALTSLPLSRPEALTGSPAGGLDGIQPAPGSSNGFGTMLDGLVNLVDQKQAAEQVTTQKVLLGDTDQLHQSVIAIQEASVALSLMVQVRNKLVESYQELMRMQV